MSKYSEDEDYRTKQEQEEMDRMIAQAVEAASKGENIKQLLEVMLASVSGSQKEVLRKKFAFALKKRNLREPKGDADVPSRDALTRLRDALAMTARQAMERVAALVRTRPDVAERIAQAGQALAKNGVTIDRIQISEAELGTIVSNSMNRSQGRGEDTGRGA